MKNDMTKIAKYGWHLDRIHALKAGISGEPTYCMSSQPLDSDEYCDMGTARSYGKCFTTESESEYRSECRALKREEIVISHSLFGNSVWAC